MSDEKIEVLDVDNNSGNNSQNIPKLQNHDNNSGSKHISRVLKNTNNRTANNKTLKGKAGDKLQSTAKGMKKIGSSGEKLGKATKVAGKGMKAAGKGIKAGGKAVKAGTQAIGTAASAIPVVGGAIGAGIKAAGSAANAAAQAGGKVAELGGKALDKTGSAVEKGAGKLKDTAGKVETKGKAMSATEEITKGKPAKLFKAMVKLIVGIIVYAIMHFPLFFLLFILIGAAIDDNETNYFGTSGIAEFYVESAMGNIQKSVINELSKPVEEKDGFEVNFTGSNNYGISNGYMHNGIDLNVESIGVGAGAEVKSIYDGFVDSVGTDNSPTEPGYWVKIKHEIVLDNQDAIIYSIYKGLDESTAYYVSGDKIMKEQKIGVISSQGSLHFEIQNQDGKPLDPINIYIPFTNAVIANTVTGNEVIDKIITMITTSNVLDDRMKDNVHIASILGNIQAESGFNVASSQAGVPKEQVNENTPLAIGLVQWDYERKENLIYYSRAEGSTWYDIDIQLRFFEGELTRDNRSSLSDNIQKYTSYQLGNGFDKWLNETNPETAATIYTDSFERCDPEYCHYEKRKFSARCWYNLLQNGQNSADYCMTHES